MGMIEDEVHRLVGMAYDAALDEQIWPIFLEAFARAMGETLSLLGSEGLQTQTGEFVAV
jgi:hypothetical protein